MLFIARKYQIRFLRESKKTERASMPSCLPSYFSFYIESRLIKMKDSLDDFFLSDRLEASLLP